MIVAWMINSPGLLPPLIIIHIITVIIFSYGYGIIEPMRIITLAPSATHYTKDIIEHS